MVKYFGGVGEQAGRIFLKQMIDQMEYLQKSGVAHRDLKLENILVNSEMKLKLADFGCSEYYRTIKSPSNKGTDLYKAPEIVEEKSYDGFKTDIFALGVILYTIVDGIFPFHSSSKSDKFYSLLTSSDAEKRKDYWYQVGAKSLSNNFKDLFSKMVEYNPETRLSLK